MPREIDDKDLQQLRKIRRRSDELVYELGENALERDALERQLEAARERRKRLVEEVRQVDERAGEAGRDLQKKYGEGTFDLDKGVFTEDG